MPSVLDNVELEVRAGEILGVAGLVGAGRTEMARAIFGADPFDAGRIIVDGQRFLSALRRTRSATASVLCRRTGSSRPCFWRSPFAPISAWPPTIALRDGESLSTRRQSAPWFRSIRKALNIRMASPEQIIANLSGGNQQKVVLARWLALRPRILIVDEPTRGIDIGAKVDVHGLLFEMARSGIAVIAISSELPEILAISDRIVTMREGRVTGNVPRDQASEEMLMAMMTLSARSRMRMVAAIWNA